MKSLRTFGLLAIMMVAFGIIASAQVNVNPGAGSYTTLKGAFDAINLGTHTGAITVDIVGDTTETLSAVLNASGSGATSYTSIVISPSGGAARSISGSFTGYLVDLNGADNVTINGLNVSGNSLTISNASTAITTATVRFINDASNNVITNTSLLGSTSGVGAFGVVYFASGTTTGNDGNSVNNCNIGPAGLNSPQNGVFSSGLSTAVDNSGNTLDSNNIFDYFNQGNATNGIQLTSTGNSTWTITNNKLYQTANRIYTTANTHNGINIQTGAGYTISGNVLGFANSSGAGTTNMVGLTSGSLGGTFPSAYTTGGTANATRYIAINAAFSAAGAVSSIQNNTIAGYALYTSSAATTTTGIFCGVCVTSGNVNIGTMTGNTIGTPTASIYTASTTAGGAMVAGIYTTSGNTVAIQNNIIQNIDSMGTVVANNGAINGINAAGTALYTISGNTIGNATNPNLRMGNLTTAANLSNVGTTFGTSTGAGVFQGILHSSTNAAASLIGTAASPNIIRNVAMNSSSTLAFIRGILVSGGLANVTKNSILNLTSAGTSTSGLSGATINGISITTLVAGQTVSQNSIQSLSNTTGTAAVVVTGIYWTNSSVTPSLIERNLIQNNTIASSGLAILNGIYTFNGSATFRNNMIRLGTDSLGTSIVSGSLTIYGFQVDTGSTQTNNFFNNSVLIAGSGVSAGTGNTFGFRRLTTETLTDIRNNIFVNNRSNSTGTGKHYNVSLNVITAATLNYNLYNQTGTGAVQGVIGATDSVTFAAWQAATTQEANSSFADPLWVSVTDLHLTSSSPARDTGVVISTVTNDFDAKLRPGANALYDRGADEFDGIAPVTNDIQATAFIDPTASGVKLVGSTLIPQASFTNNGTAGQTSVTVRYRILDPGSIEIYNQIVVIPSIATLATTTVSFPSTTVGSAGVYTIIAKAELGSDTVTSNDQISSNFTAATPLSGTYTVGSGGSFTSLTNNSGIFQSINNLGATGNITINITSDLTSELGTNALSQIAGGFAVTIQPSGGAAKQIIGNNSTTALIDFNGADNVTIDGLNTGGDSLLIRNTGTAPTVRFINDASTNILRNSTIEGASTTATVNISTGTTTGNDDIQILNNTIRDRSDAVGVPFNAVHSVGTNLTGNSNTNITVTNNQIFNFTQAGFLSANSENISFTQNTIYQTAPRTTALSGVAVNSALGTNLFSRNVVRDLTTTLATNGMVFNDARATTVSRNWIYNIPSTSGSTATLTGIVFNGGSGTAANVTVANNFVSIVPAFTNAQITRGILDFAFTGNTFTSFYNSVLLDGTASGTTNSFACGRLFSAPTAFTFQNNVCFNNRTGGTGNHYAMSDQSANTGTFVSDYNMFVGTGATAANFYDYGTSSTGTPVSYTAWQTGPPTRDANSIQSNPGIGNYTVLLTFVSQTDLHTKLTSPGVDKGIAVSVLDDFDGSIRSVVGFAGGIPDIGGDEFVAPSAATASVRGRLISGFGRNLANANVSITNTATGEILRTRSNQLGYFNFRELGVGDIYVVEVQSKRFRFENHTFTLNEDLTDLVLTAQ